MKSVVKDFSKPIPAPPPARRPSLLPRRPERNDCPRRAPESDLHRSAVVSANCLSNCRWFLFAFSVTSAAECLRKWVYEHTIESEHLSQMRRGDTRRSASGSLPQEIG